MDAAVNRIHEPKIEDEEISEPIFSIIRGVLKSVDWDRELARAKVIEMFMSDHELFETHKASLVKRWAGVIVNSVSTKTRASLVEASEKGVSGESQFKHGKGYDAWISRGIQDWLEDYRISTGKKLGDCTKADLLKEIKIYDDYAKANAVKARWNLDIVAKLGNADKVRDKFKHEQIDKLVKKASIG